MDEKFFVASCVFTEEYPELSRKVQKYISEKNLPIIRCCVPNFRVADCDNRVPEDFRDDWKKLSITKNFLPEVR